mgnify:CR=1 FL=1
MPSSSGLGEFHVIILSIQVFSREDNPIEGTIAIGSFNKGISTNQGLVGLSQKYESRPVKYRKLEGEVIIIAST